MPSGTLTPPGSIDPLLPSSLTEATAIARKEHPAIAGATYDIDAAQFGVGVAEASLLPSVALQGSISRGRDTDPTLDKKGLDQASILAQINVPVYDGGLAPSQIRQAKELVAQSRLILDQVRAQTEAAVAAAWQCARWRACVRCCGRVRGPGHNDRARWRQEGSSGRAAHDP
jgi:outer membrane protein